MEDLKGTKSKVFKVRNGDTIRSLTSTSETRGLTDSEQEIIFDSCRCGAILHNPKEVAATCVGGESLCQNCAQVRCEECNKVMCPDHAKEWKERKLCNQHSGCAPLVLIILGIFIFLILANLG
ncbi:hypothetical protein MYX82_02765 [Acidobacteria bacterium AH-259-D05]|nr:hypothetical protein [Acidobacteria bacterium AH-259-D05]